MQKKQSPGGVTLQYVRAMCTRVNVCTRTKRKNERERLDEESERERERETIEKNRNPFGDESGACERTDFRTNSLK